MARRFYNPVHDPLVPNALVRQLADTSKKSFWHRCGQRHVVALGLLSLVDLKAPGAEVITNVTTVLEIVQLARSIRKDFTNKWKRKDGTVMANTTTAMVFPPTSFNAVHEAMVALHDTPLQIETVTFQRTNRKSKATKRVVKLWAHFLDSFRYVYEEDGRELDIDLEPSIVRRSINADAGRPVYQLTDRRRPRAIGFRINTELAREVAGGGRRYTIFAKDVFAILRELHHDPGAMRFALWVISQRDRDIKRSRPRLFDDLLQTGQHLTVQERETRLEVVLTRLRALGVIESYHEQAYAKTSHGKGNYLVIRKAAKWDLAPRKEGKANAA